MDSTLEAFKNFEKRAVVKSRPKIFMIFRIATRENRINFPRLHRVGSSMVEQRPFKALVEGSSPSQPTPPHRPQTRIKSSPAGFSRLNCDAPECTRKHGIPLFIGTLLADFRGALSEGKSWSKDFQDLSQTFPTLTNSVQLTDFSVTPAGPYLCGLRREKRGEKKRAGEGNRTLVCSLGSCRSTIELHPRRNNSVVSDTFRCFQGKSTPGDVHCDLADMGCAAVFEEENALPGSEDHAAFGDRDDFACAGE